MRPKDPPLYVTEVAPANAKAKAPVILFHDSLGSVELWRDFPAKLANATGRKCLLYDRVGHGRSAPFAEPPAHDFVRREAEDVVPRLLERAGIGPFVALGHSVGGAIALTAAAFMGTRCVGVVTEGVQTFVEAQTLAGIRNAGADRADGELLQRLAKYHGDKAPALVAAWARIWLDPAFSGWTLAGVLQKVVAPILAVHGSLDEFGSAAHPRMIAAHAAGPVQVELLEGVGHVPHREKAPEVLSLIAAFLAKLP